MFSGEILPQHRLRPHSPTYQETKEERRCMGEGRKEGGRIEKRQKQAEVRRIWFKTLVCSLFSFEQRLSYPVSKILSISSYREVQLSLIFWSGLD